MKIMPPKCVRKLISLITACFLCLTGAFWEGKNHLQLAWKVSARLRSPCAFYDYPPGVLWDTDSWKLTLSLSDNTKSRGKLKIRAVCVPLRLRSAAAWLFSYDFGTHSIKSAQRTQRTSRLLMCFCLFVKNSPFVKPHIFWMQRCATQILYMWHP